MPRYELSEGSSNKFWDIKLSGKSFTTTYGKLGANGQTTIKEFSSDALAKKEFEKLVAEKTKKGYALVGGKAAAPAKAKKKAAKPTDDDEDDESSSTAGGATDARNPALEKAILTSPLDRDAYAVFADWLQEQGDPRGELISLQLGNKEGAAQKLIQKHSDYFLGELAPFQNTRDSSSDGTTNNNSHSHLRTSEQEKAWQKTAGKAFLWRNGYISRLRVSEDTYAREASGDEDDETTTAEIVEKVFAHPSGRYVTELNLMSNGDPNETDLQDVLDVVGKKAPKTLRKLVIGDNVDQISWHHTGDLGKIWKGVPNLKILEIETGEFDVGKMDAPNLERAIFVTGGLSKACGKHIANASMPKVKHLEIYYGTDNYGGDCTVKEVKPLLERTDLKDLQYLGLKNSEFANDIAKAVVGAKIVKQLKVLDLSLGTLTDEGAQALADGKESLKHLEVLDLTRNYLTKAGIKLVAGLCKKVITDRQEKPDDYDGEPQYYCQVTE
jgi:uncharacterized protein (TIGR02996 family)